MGFASKGSGVSPPAPHSFAQVSALYGDQGMLTALPRQNPAPVGRTGEEWRGPCDPCDPLRGARDHWLQPDVPAREGGC